MSRRTRSRFSRCSGFIVLAPRSCSSALSSLSSLSFSLSLSLSRAALPFPCRSSLSPQSSSRKSLSLSHGTCPFLHSKHFFSLSLSLFSVSLSLSFLLTEPRVLMEKIQNPKNTHTPHRASLSIYLPLLEKGERERGGVLRLKVIES